MSVKEELARAKEALLANLCDCRPEPPRVQCFLHTEQAVVDSWTDEDYKRRIVLARRVLGIEKPLAP